MNSTPTNNKHDFLDGWLSGIHGTIPRFPASEEYQRGRAAGLEILKQEGVPQKRIEP